MCSLWKMTFTLAPMVPLTVLSPMSIFYLPLVPKKLMTLHLLITFNKFLTNLVIFGQCWQAASHWHVQLNALCSLVHNLCLRS